MRIVFFGKPGSGKGTQAQRLSRALGLPHLSSGDLLRGEIEDRTELGLRIEPYVLRGEIGPEELIAAAVLERIGRRGHGDGYILDGFPRTLLQAGELDAAFPPHKCILLDVADRTAAGRITGRLTCRRCGAVFHASARPPRLAGTCDLCEGALEARADDTAGAVMRRLEIFHTQVGPVLKWYANDGRLVVVDAEGLPDAVEAAVRAAL
jgi:adenylate kinase